jgi:8-oxo-dGTP pyrophosphatase MutT (NUDIX family)
VALSPFQASLVARLAGRRPVTIARPDGWWAGVAVLLVPDPDAVLLIRRAERAGDPWSGQMALPGGRLDPADPDLGATAVRETGEEVGIWLDQAALLAQLDDVSPRMPLPRPVIVRPFLFALPHRPAMRLSEEVASAAWFPLTRFAEPGVFREVDLLIRGETRRFPGYQMGDDLVWGLTERILTPLLDLARDE